MAQTVRIEMPIQAVDKTNPALSNITNRLNRMEAASRKVQASVSRTILEVSRFDKQSQKTQKNLANWMKEKYQIILEAQDKVSPAVEKLSGRLNALGRQNWDVTIRAVDLVTGPVTAVGKRLDSLAEKARKIGGTINFTVTESMGRQGAASKGPGGASSGGITYPNVPQTAASDVRHTSGSGTKLIYPEQKSGKASGEISFVSTLGEVSSTLSASKTVVELGGKILGMGRNSGSGEGSARGTALATAAVAGGVVAADVLFDGIDDAGKALNSKNKEEATAHGWSGAAKIGGVGLGAIIGTAILPGLGTAIGAGIGGFIGSKGGDAITDSYEKRTKAQKLADAQAKYSSQELKDALEDTSMTAEEFGRKFQEVVAQDLQDHFGNLKLSLEEISDLARDIVFEDSIENAQNFQKAVTEAERSLAGFQDSSDKLDKINWKIEVSPKVSLSESETEGYIEAVNQYVEQAKEYIENKHYEATLALHLLFEPGTGSDLYDTLNETYGKSRKRINKLGRKLFKKIDDAKEDDGVVDGKEYEEIYGIQKELGGEMDKVQAAGEAAAADAIKIKYTGAGEKLSSETFTKVQRELQQQAQTSAETNYGALESGLVTLKLAKENGLDDNVYQDQRQELINKYNEKNEKVKSNSLNYQFDTIGEAFFDKLQGIFPDTKTASEKLNQGMHDAMAHGEDPTTWKEKPDIARRWLGLEGLTKDEVAPIAELVGQVAATIPEELKEAALPPDDIGQLFFQWPTFPLITGGEGETEGLGGLSGLLPETGKTLGNTLPSSISEGMSSNTEGVQPGCEAVRTAADEYMGSAFSTPFNVSANVNITAKYNLMNKPPFAPSGLGTGLYPTFHAAGDIVNGRQLSWVGEEGPEAIIPLIPSRRSRALELFQKTGEMLGLGGYAEGGIVGNQFYQDGLPSYSAGLPDGKGQKTDIHVEVQLSPNFEVSGKEESEEDVMDVIRRHLKEMADEVGGQIATNLEAVFSNMPLSEGA